MTPTHSLDSLCYDGGRPEHCAGHLTAPVGALVDYLDRARTIFAEASGRCATSDDGSCRLDGADEERLRWFPLPGDVG